VTRYRTLIVDDERPARAKVARLLKSDARFEAVGEARDGLDALAKIEALRPDLVVLDIQMPGIGGFEVLEALGPEPGAVVIFSTAYEQHALRAFEANAVDYLLKPYDATRFKRALDKAHVLLAGRMPVSWAGLLDAAATKAARERLVVKSADGAWVTVELNAIVRISAANKHVCVFTSENRYLVRQPLAAIAARLNGDRFVQVHRSEIVRVDAVARIEPWTHGDMILVLSDGATVVLTRTHRKAFLERFRR
jgi:two-component system, LytTR family, response regulator